MASDPPQMGVNDATKAADAAKTAKAAEIAKATKAAKAAAAKAAKTTEAARAAAMNKPGGDHMTPEAFVQMQEQIKTLTQGLQAAMQENADLRKQISEPSISNQRHSERPEEDDRDDAESSEKESQNRRKHDKPPLEKQPHEQEALLKMQDQIDGLMKHIKAQTPATVEEIVQNTDSPFTSEVMGLPLPRKFKMPQLETFNGSTDPLDHLETYKSLMHLQIVPDEVMCRALFPVTLKGSAWAWFNKLPPGSIRSFKELSTSFVSYFIAGQRYNKPPMHLLIVKQGRWESLREYTTRFNKEVVQIEEVDDSVSITAYIAGLYSRQFLYLLSQEPPKTLAELMLRAQKHMNAEEAIYARRSSDSFDPHAGPSQVGEFPPSDRKRRESTRKTGGEPKNKKVDSRSSPKRGGGPPQGKYKQFTPLIATAEQILSNLQNNPDLKWPEKLRTDPNKRAKEQYCRFHRDHGHNMDDCIDLKQQIEELIQRGRLQHFVTKKYQKIPMRDDTSKERKDATAPRSGLIREIKVIHGGLAGGGESSNARKAHLRKLRTEEYLEVNTVSRPSKIQKKEEIPILFSEEDIKGTQVPHDDRLVITIVVANYLTGRVLIDSGSSTDILYLHAYDQLNVG
ncbi:uncharacterized protein LOC131309503 [Rhododendron vialii]|uniref:uncharacterized protein LOC131309503 n=1 Tax=Rhododendron vialii TaxID=182163 RepID=UPI00265E6ACF|nr:uncharacterized protein LOC131309503 [Rhododendron vialii]